MILQLNDLLELGASVKEIHCPSSDKKLPSKEEFVILNITSTSCDVLFPLLTTTEIHCLFLEKVEFAK